MTFLGVGEAINATTQKMTSYPSSHFLDGPAISGWVIAITCNKCIVPTTYRTTDEIKDHKKL